jgi:biopolymer transport protein ExbD
MSFGRLDQHASNKPVAEINVTPMVDVMLVLLVIFIITAPLMASSVRVELPKADAGPAQAEPQAIAVSITADGALYLKDEKLSLDEMTVRFAAAAKRDANTEVHLRADQKTAYGTVAKIMAAAQKSGLQRIGFVTDPVAERP